MNKKNFKTTFNDLLGEGKSEDYKVKKSSDHKETKSTFVIRCDHLDKLRAISYLERKMIKDVLADALNAYLDKYEKENGTIQLPKA